MKLLANNKKAFHDYHVLDKYECGIVLKGTEIKSIRAGKVNIKDSYCSFRHGELFVVGMHVSKYNHGNIFNHDETRNRKLLLHKRELVKLENKVNQESLSIVPLKVYIEKGLCKLEIALAKGKKTYDKRQSLKEKDMKKRMDKAIKERY